MYPVHTAQARALLPLGFPRPSSPSSTDFNDTEGHLKNQWCMVSASLPVGVGGPLARLEAVRKVRRVWRDEGGDDDDYVEIRKLKALI